MSSAHRYSWERADGSKGRAWRAQWVGPDGRTLAKRGFDRQSDALAYAADREAEARHGVTLAGERPTGRTTVASWSATWLEAQEVRPSTAEAYRFALQRIEATFGGRSLASLRPSEIKSWRRGLSSRYAESTASQTASIFAMLLRAAERDGLIDRSPMPPTKAAAGRVVDPDELLTLEQVRAWDAALPKHARGMALVAAATGLRRGELLGLRNDDVDWLRRTLRVSVQLGADRQYGPPKTPASLRTVPLIDEALDALSAHLAAFPSRDGEPLFCTARGGRWSRSAFQECNTRAARRAELPSWTHWHALRDVAASALIESGTNLRTVMAIMGHASAEETLRTYARLWPNAQEDARANLGAVWSRSSERHGSATST